MHLIVNPNPVTPVAITSKWFVEGWNGYAFNVNENGYIIPKPITEAGWRSSVMREQMWTNTALMNHTIEFFGGICRWVEAMLNIGDLVWAEDIDEQPDDYLDPYIEMERNI